MNTKIINLFGGPCAGKSTSAAGVFHEMKKLDYDVEYVTEYAKDVVFEKCNTLLENQIHIFSEQYRRQFKLLGQVEYIITDSPIALSCVYFDIYNSKSNRYDEVYTELSKKFFLETFKLFDSKNYFIRRDVSKYSPQGRLEDLNQSIEIDNKIMSFLSDNNIEYLTVDQNDAVWSILKNITKKD